MKQLNNRGAGCSFVALGGVAILMIFTPALCVAETLASLSSPEVSSIIAGRETTVRQNTGSGEWVNLPLPPMPGVEVLVRRVWHWGNEYRPEPDPPRDADYFVVPAEITAGETKPVSSVFPPGYSVGATLMAK